MITIKDMAEMLGISTTTVSNVIHGKTSEVSQKTVERVEKLLDKYEYVPNISARSLSQNSSKIIGVALKCRKDKYANLFSDPFFGELIGALEAEIRQEDAGDGAAGSKDAVEKADVCGNCCNMDEKEA